MRTFYLAYLAGLLAEWMTAQGQRLFCLRFGHKHAFVSDIKRAKAEGHASAWATALYRHTVSLISKSCSCGPDSFYQSADWVAAR